MTTNVANRSPYLRTSREFPSDPQALSVELSKTYLDIANIVNARTIGTFATVPIVTGNVWFFSGSSTKQQTIRQTYNFTATTSINHTIKNVIPGQFIFCFGSYTDGTNTYGLIYGTSVAVAGVIQFYVTSTQIVFVVGAGAPALTSGKICLEWTTLP